MRSLNQVQKSFFTFIECIRVKLIDDMS